MNNILRQIQKQQQLIQKCKNTFCLNKSKIEVPKNISLTHELDDDLNATHRKQVFEQYYNNKDNQVIEGFATAEGTLNYSQRKADIVNEQHFNTPFRSDLKLSSIGIGTYQGAPDSVDDIKMFNAIVDSVQSGGVNVIDTALNYRYMKSERTVGAALQHLINDIGYERNELFVASKGGYLIDDADNDFSIDQQITDLKEKYSLPQEDIVTDIHSMNPIYLDYSLNKSLKNLGLDTLDLFYLHNSAEQQMSLIGEEKFMERLKYSFEYLQRQVDETQKIKAYGLATWICFRSPRDEEKIHLSLKKINELATEIAGKDHGLKYIQLPINIMMAEAFGEKWQESCQDPQSEDYEENVFLLRAARENQINIMSSSPIMQGALLQVPLPTDVFKCKNLVAKHLQFIRSIPSPAVISTMIGQKANRHVKMNLEVIQHAPLTIEEFWEFMTPKERVQHPEEAIELD